MAAKKFPFKVGVYCTIMVSKEFDVMAEDEASAEEAAIEEAAKSDSFFDWEIDEDQDEDPSAKDFFAIILESSDDFTSKLTKKVGSVTPAGGRVCAAPKGAKDA
jgi:hypothetical protein